VSPKLPVEAQEYKIAGQIIVLDELDAKCLSFDCRFWCLGFGSLFPPL